MRKAKKLRRKESVIMLKRNKIEVFVLATFTNKRFYLPRTFTDIFFLEPTLFTERLLV